jgi:hypothetical protein
VAGRDGALAGVLVLLIVLLFTSAEVSAGEKRVSLVSDSDCPSGEAVAGALAPLLRQTQVQLKQGEGSETATIHDGGSWYEVSLLDEKRSFQEPQRLCEERARAAAVFLGLILEPPTFFSLTELSPDEAALAEEEPQLETTGEELGDVPLRSHDSGRPGEWRNTWEGGALVRLAPHSSTNSVPVQWGLQARGIWGREGALSLGIKAFLPHSLNFDEADVSVTRAAGDVSFRLRKAFEVHSLALELGPELSLVATRGVKVTRPQSELRLETGARAAISAMSRFSAKWGAFVAAEGVLVPRPSRYWLLPERSLGTAPALWLGTTLGLAW